MGMRMNGNRWGVAAMAAAVLAGGAVRAFAQRDVFGKPETKVAAVEFLFPEQVTAPAGAVSRVSLHFRIAPGLHINSHTPREEELIPTTFSIPEGAGVRLESASYPAGVDYTLPADPKHPLSVYTGEFAIETRIVAERGDHLVEAKLRYQACDQRQCMPPRTITVAVDVVGK